MFSDLTLRQFRKFRRIKRAWYSFWILSVLFILSLFSEHLANERPLLLNYEGRWFFPTLQFYSDQEFGGAYRTEADYRVLNSDPDFKEAGGWMVFPLVAYGPYISDWSEPGTPPHPPSIRHPLGTDSSARDIFARVLYGFRTGMLFALSLAAISTVIGILIGGIQGYLGGSFDLGCQRLIEIWSALPFLYVVILLGSIYGQSFAILLLVFVLFRWIGISYYTRAEFFRLKNQAFVEAARSLGGSNVRLIFRHILPNSLNPIITILPFMLVTAITALTALDFLGFGIAPPAPSWGELLQQGLNNLYAPWMALSAVGALFITLLLASFIGEGAREAFDPKSQ